MSCNNCSPNFSNDTQLNPGCPSCGQKCHEVVDTATDVALYHNAFVTVREENAVYHVDEVGNPLLISRPPIFAANTYTPTAGDYKQVIVYKFSTNQFFVFDPTGAYKTGTLS